MDMGQYQDVLCTTLFGKSTWILKRPLYFRTELVHCISIAWIARRLVQLPCLSFEELDFSRGGRWRRWRWYLRDVGHGLSQVHVYCEIRKEAVTFTSTPISLNSAGARGLHRCASGKIGGLAEAHTGSKRQSDVTCWYPSRYPCRMHAYIPVGNPLGYLRMATTEDKVGGRI